MLAEWVGGEGKIKIGGGLDVVARDHFQLVAAALVQVLAQAFEGGVFDFVGFPDAGGVALEAEKEGGLGLAAEVGDVFEAVDHAGEESVFMFACLSRIGGLGFGEEGLLRGFVEPVPDVGAAVATVEVVGQAQFKTRCVSNRQAPKVRRRKGPTGRRHLATGERPNGAEPVGDGERVGSPEGAKGIGEWQQPVGVRAFHFTPASFRGVFQERLGRGGIAWEGSAGRLRIF